MTSTGTTPVVNAIKSSGCCDTVATVAVNECYSYPKTCLSLTNYATACGCCGETYILADLNGDAGKAKHCTLVEIKGDKLGGGFELQLTIGCEKHTIALCKLPTDAALWESIVYSALATDSFMLTNNATITIVKSADFFIALGICVECPISVATFIPTTSKVTIGVSPQTVTNDAPKLGQFLSYAVSGDSLNGVKTYDATNYAGYLMLPDSIPQNACCVPDTCGCNAVGSCRKILRTGKARVPLAVPFPSAITGNVQLATKSTGEIVAYSGAVPSDYTAFPFPHSIVMDPTTIDSSLITVVFH